MVGNKTDLKNKRQVTEEEGKNLGNNYLLFFI